MEINEWKEKLYQFIVDNQVPNGAKIYVNSNDFYEKEQEIKQWSQGPYRYHDDVYYLNRLLVPSEDIKPGEFEYVESVRSIQFGSVSNHAVIDFEYKNRTEDEYQLDWLVYKADQLANSGVIWTCRYSDYKPTFYKGYEIKKEEVDIGRGKKARVHLGNLISEFYTWSPEIHKLYLKLYSLSEIAKDINQSVLPVDDDVFDDVVKYMVYPLDKGVTSIEYRGIKFVKDNFESEKMENTKPFFDELIINEKPKVAVDKKPKVNEDKEAYEWMIETIKSFDLGEDKLDTIYVPSSDYNRYEKPSLTTETGLGDHWFTSSDKVPDYSFVIKTKSGKSYIHDSLRRPTVQKALTTLRSLPKGQTELVVDDCTDWFGYLSLVGNWTEAEETEFEYYSKLGGKTCVGTPTINWNGIHLKFVNKYERLYKPEEKMEQTTTPPPQPLQNKVNFNDLGIFFFAPETFEPKPMFGQTPQQQLVTILNLFQQGILVEGFYKTIVVNNG